MFRTFTGNGFPLQTKMASQDVKDRLRSMPPKVCLPPTPPAVPVARVASTASAKKKKKKLREKLKVCLTSQFERWGALRGQVFAKTPHLLKPHNRSKADTELSRILMDAYERTQEAALTDPQPGCSTWDIESRAVQRPDFAKQPPQKTSTPGQLLQQAKVSTTPDLSSVPSSSKPCTPLSGVEPFEEEPELEIEKTDQPAKEGKGMRSKRQNIDRSFVNPLNITVEFSDLTCDGDLDGDDSDFDVDDIELESQDASFFLTMDVDEKYAKEADEVAFEEVAYGQQEDEETGDADTAEEVELGPGITRIATADQCQDICNSTLCLAFVHQLKALAAVSIRKCSTAGCEHVPAVKEGFTGSALYLRWECVKGHVSHTWCAQPTLPNKIHCGDFLVSTCILLSGNNYAKLALWAKVLNLPFPGATFHQAVQKHYVVQAVKDTWKDHQRAIFDSLAEQNLVVLGDGRNDSPGHCAQYCSYTLMEAETTKILSVQCVDKRETQRKSTNMERVGFKRALDEVVLEGERVDTTVDEVVTDAHVGIAADMKAIGKKHSLDVWHVAKNIGKKLAKIAAGSKGRKLQKWIPSIVNHFWFCCQKADTKTKFMGMWRGVLQHVCNIHSWDAGAWCCDHEDLGGEREDGRAWLDPQEDRALVKQLASVVLDQTLIQKAELVITNRSTCPLEVFHQHLLMYAGKRFAYTPPVYEARILLAAMDHNTHAGRPLATSKDGRKKYHRCFNKKTGRWSVFPVKVPKTYHHIPALKLRIMEMRLQDPLPLHRKKPLAQEDPRRLSTHLAATSPPPTSELVAQKKSRFT
ncbi:uncharacterized protein [Littorina saxatilis]